MFASQAAMAVSNARKHREEHRARVSLETLVDTSPVGVAVFDAATGAPVSFNRGDDADCGGADGRRPDAGAAAGSADLPAGGRAGGLAAGMAAGGIVALRGDGAGGRDSPERLRRPERHRRAERNAHPRGGGRDRVLRRHPPGHDGAGGDGAAARGVPGHDQPRAAHAADLHQRLGNDHAGGGAGPGRGGAAPIPADHRGPGGQHAGADRRPAGRGAHRGGRAAGQPGTLPDGAAGGPGQEHVPERRRQRQPGHKPGPGPAPGDGGQTAHCAGHRQPAVQRGTALPGVVRDPGAGGPGGRARGDLGRRRGAGHPRGAAAAVVPQVLREHEPGGRRGGRGAGPGHMQGHCGGPRRTHLGGERRRKPGGAVHLHGSRGRRGLGPGPAPSLGAGAAAVGGGVDPGGGRRPADADGHPQGAAVGRVRPGCDGGPGGGGAPDAGQIAQPGAAGHDASGVPTGFV